MPWQWSPWAEAPPEYFEALRTGKPAEELADLLKKNNGEWEKKLAPAGSNQWAISALSKFAEHATWQATADTLECLEAFARDFNKSLYRHAEWPFDWAPKPPRVADLTGAGKLENVERAAGTLIAALRDLDDISLGLILRDAMVRAVDEGWQIASLDRTVKKIRGSADQPAHPIGSDLVGRAFWPEVTSLEPYFSARLFVGPTIDRLEALQSLARDTRKDLEANEGVDNGGRINALRKLIDSPKVHLIRQCMTFVVCMFHRKGWRDLTGKHALDDGKVHGDIDDFVHGMIEYATGKSLPRDSDDKQINALYSLERSKQKCFESCLESLDECLDLCIWPAYSRHEGQYSGPLDRFEGTPIGRILREEHEARVAERLKMVGL